MILRFSSLPVEGSNWSGPLRSDARFDSAVHRSMGGFIRFSSRHDGIENFMIIFYKYCIF